MGVLMAGYRCCRRGVEVPADLGPVAIILSWPPAAHLASRSANGIRGIVIGLADNILRPQLRRQDLKLA